MKIASILGLGCLSHSTKNKSLPENMNTIDKRCNHSHYTPLSGRLGWIEQKTRVNVPGNESSASDYREVSIDFIPGN